MNEMVFVSSALEPKGGRGLAPRFPLKSGQVDGAILSEPYALLFEQPSLVEGGVLVLADGDLAFGIDNAMPRDRPIGVLTGCHCISDLARSAWHANDPSDLTVGCNPPGRNLSNGRIDLLVKAAFDLGHDGHECSEFAPNHRCSRALVGRRLGTLLGRLTRAVDALIPG